MRGPHVHDLLDSDLFAPIRAMFNAPSNVDVTETSFLSTLSNLAILAQRWRTQPIDNSRLRFLAKLLPPKLTAGYSWSTSTSLSPAHRLNAVYVQQSTDRVFVGYDSVPCSPTFPLKELLFSPEGSSAADYILELLGLDHRATDFLHLDRLNPRFTCLVCPIVVTGGFKGRLAMKWRTLVSGSYIKILFCPYVSYLTTFVT